MSSSPDGAVPWHATLRDSATLRLLGLTTTGLAVVAAATGAALATTPYDVSWFTDDVSERTGQPWHIGLLSGVGLLLWCAAATAAAVTAAVVLSGGRPAPGEAPLLVGGAALSSYLLLDDLLLLHDHHFPVHLGVQDALSLGAYGVAFLAWLWASRKALRRSPALPLLALSIVAFAGSSAIDALPWRSTALEEGLEIAGGAYWVAFFVRMALERTHPRSAAR